MGGGKTVMSSWAVRLGEQFAEFLAVGDYDNARAALDEFRAAKGVRHDNNRTIGTGDLGSCGIHTVLREYRRA